MHMIRLGNELASEIYTELQNLNIVPKLGIIQVNDLMVSNKYISIKKKRIEALNWKCEHIQVFSEVGLDKEVKRMSKQDDIDGIIVQLPIPIEYNRDILDQIPPYKDVDGITTFNQGRLFMGIDETRYLAPCTAKACIYLLEQNKVELNGIHAGVLGRSCLVGKPIGMMLQNRGATVVQIHQEDKNQSELSRLCKVLVSAIGVPWYVTKKYVLPNAFVVDIGLSQVGEEIRGDVHPEVSDIACVTPSKGGIGPLTVAFLMKNLALTKIMRQAL